MTRYLLDRDVMSQLDLREADRHVNVRAWLRSVPDDSLHVSAITVMEAWKGFSILRRRSGADPAGLERCDAYEAAFRRLLDTFADRVIPIDAAVAEVWGTLIGQRDKNRFDLGIAATARTHDMVVATRNLADFTGREARVIDPFHGRPAISGGRPPTA